MPFEDGCVTVSLVDQWSWENGISFASPFYSWYWRSGMVKMFTLRCTKSFVRDCDRPPTLTQVWKHRLSSKVIKTTGQPGHLALNTGQNGGEKVASLSFVFVGWPKIPCVSHFITCKRFSSKTSQISLFEWGCCHTNKHSKTMIVFLVSFLVIVWRNT